MAICISGAMGCWPCYLVGREEDSKVPPQHEVSPPSTFFQDESLTKAVYDLDLDLTYGVGAWIFF